jgi:N-acyl-phosphatidylethanolamine-hydrolysing phospholipase D
VAKWILWDSLRRRKTLSFGMWLDRDLSALPSSPPDDADSDFLRTNRTITTVTWIGHSSFLIQIDGLNILTDPVWSDRIFGRMGPRRFTAPGIPVHKLPEIDCICISHDHYDHLDLPTLSLFGNKPQYLVPLGVDRILAAHGIGHAHALTWWQSMEYGPLRLHSVPAQHFSVRAPFDRDTTLWAGWLIEGRRHRIYFAGDTGFFERQFREIKHHFGPIHVAILPIGAYEPSWLMQPVHLNPFEAVEAFRILDAGVLIPCHWGTFKLSEEALGDPLDDLRRAAAQESLSPDSLWIPEPGKTRRIGDGV